jgi:cell shape-determining protein MreC
MKTSSFLRGKGIGRGVRILNPESLRGGAVVIGVVLVLIVLRVAFPDTLASLLAPLWRVGEQATASVGSVETFFTSKEILARERDQLANENKGLQNENRILVARAQDLTALLGTRTEADDDILASVLARPPISPYDVLVIDRGTEHSVRSGALVFGNGGVPLGTIAATTERTARVLLYSAPGRETSAWVGTTRIPITLKGEGSGAFSALIPRDAAVLTGDEIYVSGSGALPVGVVSWVRIDPSATKAVVHIHPLVNPFSITWVTISSHESL